jgi:hypothetical protein
LRTWQQRRESSDFRRFFVKIFSLKQRNQLLIIPVNFICYPLDGGMYMIRAELIDGSFVRLAPSGLDLLLRHGRVKRFLRDSGWAVVGVDPLRESPRAFSYNGFERRSHAC